MTSSFGSLSMAPPDRRGNVFAAAASAASITIPHALGLGLLAFGPLAGDMPIGALALWSPAVPGALAALVAPRPGVVYAPTTVVALLFAAVVALLSGSAAQLQMAGPQVLAACGATAALGFGFQWLFGVLRLASLARFLPISVTHGFAAGVGLTMVLGQLSTSFGAGAGATGPQLVSHAAAAVAVAAIALGVNRRWPRWPGLFPGVAGVALVLWLAGWSGGFQSAAQPTDFHVPPVPDHLGVPWQALLELHGLQLVSLALLMAVVNSLDVLVFNQEMALEHGLRDDANRSLRRESAVGVLCGLCGLIPASTSASRSRIALAQGGGTTPAVGAAHAVLLLGVAATGHWWLHWVPMACLAGALLLAGYTQVPAVMWSRLYARAAPASWSQSWLVALVFPAAGGAGALLAGLAVATFVLLHASAANVVRRAHLEGQVRSRRLRRATSEAWIAPRMNQVAVVELQGVMSFGVAAYMAEQVHQLRLPRHRWVLLDAGRVPAWDSTALVHVRALGRDLQHEGIVLQVSGLDDAAAQQLGAGVERFADLDRALERVEDHLLAARPAAEAPAATTEADWLGELGEHVEGPGRRALEEAFVAIPCAALECIFRAGDTGRDLLLVRSGHVTMATQWPPGSGVRLATMGRGMVFGEMAFLNGLPRTACAGCEAEPAELMRLDRGAFDRWAAQHPREALAVLNNLALMGTRRLAATTRQLRAVLE